MKIYPNIKTTITATLFVLASLTPGVASESKAAQEVSRDFTSVAKKAIPTVVSIQVKAAAPQRGYAFRREDSDQPNDPFGFFQDDLFKHFFDRRQFPQEQERYSVGQASGFIVSQDGYILTNNHVVRGAGQISVLLNDGREFNAAVIGQDANTDLAVIKIDAKDLDYLPLGNSDALQVGQWVVAIGNPLGLQASLTVGVVSAKGRNDLDIARIEDFIQTDAAINRGNSGGPLLNLDGEVVGINTAIASSMGGYMGIGFAIPSNMAQHVMDELINEGAVSRGFLGVTLQNIDQDLAQAFGLKKVEGALVAEVNSNSPAAAAGLRQGDIILKYNNQKVTNLSSLRNAISMMKPGTTVKLTILRDGKQITLPVQVGPHPDNSSGPNVDIGNRFGFEVESITPEIAKNLGLVDESGVVVSRVKAGSPAAWIGLKKGTLIVEVNKRKVTNAESFYKALKNSDDSKPLILLIKQGGMTRFISLKLG